VVDDRLAEIRDRFERLGVPEEVAAAAAAHELESGGGLATATLLALCWHRLMNSYDRPGALSRMPVAHRLANAGASLQDLRLFARRIAFGTLFDLFYLRAKGPTTRSVRRSGSSMEAIQAGCSSRSTRTVSRPVDRSTTFM